MADGCASSSPDAPVLSCLRQVGHTIAAPPRSFKHPYFASKQQVHAILSHTIAAFNSGNAAALLRALLANANSAGTKLIAWGSLRRSLDEVPAPTASPQPGSGEAPPRKFMRRHAEQATNPLQPRHRRLGPSATQADVLIVSQSEVRRRRRLRGEMRRSGILVAASPA